jgi:hypothetical protein
MQATNYVSAQQLNLYNIPSMSYDSGQSPGNTFELCTKIPQACTFLLYPQDQAALKKSETKKGKAKQ